jgi:hypothetical protein
VGRAAQQLTAHELLERPDLAADCRLGDVQTLGGAAEVELLRDGDERAQMAQLDAVGRLGEREEGPAVVHLASMAALRPLPERW